LLTNAVKYGITQEVACSIDVTLNAADGEAQLTVENVIAGRRFTEIVSEGVGTDLINAFAQQLEGTIEAKAEDGKFRVRFTFPVPDRNLELREVDPRTAR
jgi:two-component sensor histidine kinase